MSTDVPEIIGVPEGIPPPSPRILAPDDMDIELVCTGTEYEAELAAVLGVYTRDCEDGQGPDVCAGRPTYTKQDSDIRLYYAQCASHWFIGYSLGRPSGLACARGDAATPDQIVFRHWEVKASGWQAVPELHALRVTAA
jgi:hypothetical protein